MKSALFFAPIRWIWRVKTPAIRLFVSTVFILTNIVSVYSRETNLWAERRKTLNSTGEHRDNLSDIASLPHALLQQMPSLHPSLPTHLQGKISQGLDQQNLSPKLNNLVNSIPLTHSRIQEIYDSNQDDKPTIVIIQDVHLNAEAQSNIAVVLQQLVNQKKIGLVGVEGAFEELDFSDFRILSNTERAGQVARAFLNNKLLAAPSYVGLTSLKEPPPFVGVDDRAHHQANVEAYLSTLRLKETTLSDISKIKRTLVQAKKKIFSPKLRQFDVWQTGYLTRQIGMGAYLKNLSAYGFEFDFSIEQFLEAYNIENTLDFKKVEQERKIVVEKLAASLDKKSLSHLLTLSLAYKMGTVGYGPYYQNLKILCEENGIQLTETPSFDRYIRYALLSDRIKPNALLEAIRRLELKVQEKLAQNPEEITLANLSHQVDLIEKLIDFELTPPEWEEYKNGNRDLNSIQKNLSQMRGLQLETKDHLPSVLHPYESFYIEAGIRSHKMVEKLLNYPIQQDRVLVTGGFHTPDVSALLKEKGCSFVILSPKITRIKTDSGSSYLSIFEREKTPLEHLFSGTKLFVNPTDVNMNPLLTTNLVSTALVPPTGVKELPQAIQKWIGKPIFVAPDVPQAGYQGKKWEALQRLPLDDPGRKDDEFGGVIVTEASSLKIWAWMGRPVTGAPFWEWVFQLPLLIVFALFSNNDMILTVMASGLSLIFGLAHRDRSIGERLKLVGIGLLLNGAIILPAHLMDPSVLSGIFGIMANIFSHMGYNALVLSMRRSKKNWVRKTGERLPVATVPAQGSESASSTQQGRMTIIFDLLDDDIVKAIHQRMIQLSHLYQAMVTKQSQAKGKPLDDLSVIKDTWLEAEKSETKLEKSSLSFLNRGDQIGRFEIITQLGDGGFGITYQAFDTQSSQTVLIKVPSINTGSVTLDQGYNMSVGSPLEGKAVDFILSEALLSIESTRLKEISPKTDTVPTYIDSGRDPSTGQAFLAMELIEGDPLVETKGTFALQDGILLAEAVAEFQKESNHIHNDLKPENILAVKTSEKIVGVRLVDLGNSVPIQRPADQPALGQHIWSALYSAPEKARGLVSSHSDIFSMALILSEMLSPSLLQRPDVIGLLDEALHSDSQHRPSAEQFCSRLKALPQTYSGPLLPKPLGFLERKISLLRETNVELASDGDEDENESPVEIIPIAGDDYLFSVKETSRDTENPFDLASNGHRIIDQLYQTVSNPTSKKLLNTVLKNLLEKKIFNLNRSDHQAFFLNLIESTEPGSIPSLLQYIGDYGGASDLFPKQFDFQNPSHVSLVQAVIKPNQPTEEAVVVIRDLLNNNNALKNPSHLGEVAEIVSSYQATTAEAILEIDKLVSNGKLDFSNKSHRNMLRQAGKTMGKDVGYAFRMLADHTELKSYSNNQTVADLPWFLPFLEEIREISPEHFTITLNIITASDLVLTSDRSEESTRHTIFMLAQVTSHSPTRSMIYFLMNGEDKKAVEIYTQLQKDFDQKGRLDELSTHIAEQAYTLNKIIEQENLSTVSKTGQQISSMIKEIERLRLTRGRILVEQSDHLEPWTKANTLEQALSVFPKPVNDQEELNLISVFYKDRFSIDLEIVISDEYPLPYPKDSNGDVVTPLNKRDIAELNSLLKQCAKILSNVPFQMLGLNPTLFRLLVVKNGRAYIDAKKDQRMMIATDYRTIDVFLHELGHALDPTLIAERTEVFVNPFARKDKKSQDRFVEKLRNFAEMYGYRLSPFTGDPKDDLGVLDDLIKQVYSKQLGHWRLLWRNEAYYDTSHNFQEKSFWSAFLSDLEEEKEQKKTALLSLDNHLGGPLVSEIENEYDEAMIEARAWQAYEESSSKLEFSELTSSQQTLHRERRGLITPQLGEVEKKFRPITVDFKPINHSYTYEVPPKDEHRKLDDPFVSTKLRESSVEWTAERIRKILEGPKGQQELEDVNEESHQLFTILFDGILDLPNGQDSTPIYDVSPSLLADLFGPSGLIKLVYFISLSLLSGWIFNWAEPLVFLIPFLAIFVHEFGHGFVAALTGRLAWSWHLLYELMTGHTPIQQKGFLQLVDRWVAMSGIFSNLFFSFLTYYFFGDLLSYASYEILVFFMGMNLLLVAAEFLSFHPVFRTEDDDLVRAGWVTSPLEPQVVQMANYIEAQLTGDETAALQALIDSKPIGVSLFGLKPGFRRIKSQNWSDLVQRSDFKTLLKKELENRDIQWNRKVKVAIDLFLVEKLLKNSNPSPLGLLREQKYRTRHQVTRTAA